MPENSNELPVTTEPKSCGPVKDIKKWLTEQSFAFSVYITQQNALRLFLKLKRNFKANLLAFAELDDSDNLTECQAIFCPCMVVYKTELHLKNDSGNTKGYTL